MARDDADAGAQPAVLGVRGELLAAGPILAPWPVAALAAARGRTAAASAGAAGAPRGAVRRALLLGRTRELGLDVAYGRGSEPHPCVEDRVAGLLALRGLGADGRP